jgi:hypothetical protein
VAGPTARALAAGLLAASLAACATAPAPRTEGPPTAFAGTGDGLAGRFAPVFVPEDPGPDYNRVGTPNARIGLDGNVWIGVDPARPAVFTRERTFTTEHGTYTNLIYRVHFTRTPYRLRFANVSAGRNVGLLVIVTLDADQRPVLVTTVHTCGCYLAFLPTDRLPADAYPEGWPSDRQAIWGEELPARLAVPPGPEAHPVLFYRDGTHRVMDAALAGAGAMARDYAAVPAPLRPIADLDRIPLPGGGTTSFFDTDGLHKGYVRGSVKPLEMLFVSWWSWDLFVGSDKRYGPADEMRTVFYTSLKPWRRHASDMWPFADFLRFWGWRL